MSQVGYGLLNLKDLFIFLLFCFNSILTVESRYLFLSLNSFCRSELVKKLLTLLKKDKYYPLHYT